MIASLTKTAKRKGAAILVLALLFQLFPSVALPGNGMPDAYAESSVTDSVYNRLQSYNFPDRNIRYTADFSVRIDPNVDSGGGCAMENRTWLDGWRQAMFLLSP